MFVVGAGGQAGQQALGVQLRPHIAKYLVALVDGASQRDLLRTGNAALLQRHGSVSMFDGGPLHGSWGLTANSIDGLSAPPTGVSTGDLTDFVLLWKHGDNATNFEYACGSYSGGTGAGITVRHSVIGYRWGAFDPGCSSNIADSGEVLPVGLQFLVHVRSGGSHRLYRNGKLIATVSGTNGDANATARWGHSNLGANEWLGFSAYAKVIALSGRFALALTHEQIVALSANPRGFLFDDAVADAWIAPISIGAGLTGAATSQSALSNAGAISQTHAVVGLSSAQDPTSSSAIAVQSHVTTGDNASQSSGSSVAAIVQTHTLVGANAQQSAIGSDGVLLTGALSGSPSSQASTSSTAAVSSTHQLAGIETQQGALSSTGVAQSTHTLAGLSMTQQAFASTGAVGSAHALLGAATVQLATSASGSIGGGYSYVPATINYSSPARSHTFSSAARAVQWFAELRDVQFSGVGRDVQWLSPLRDETLASAERN